jgi:hypothetical protein
MTLVHPMHGPNKFKLGVFSTSFGRRPEADQGAGALAGLALVPA